MAEKGIFNMQNFGYDKAVFGSKYRVFASKNDYNHWLLSLSVRFCPNPQATPYGAVSDIHPILIAPGTR
jgi:hypothetical protein